MAVQIYAGVPGAVDGVIAGNVGQQTEGRAAVSVRIKGSLQVGKVTPRVALDIPQGRLRHRGRVAVGTVGAIKAVLAAVAAQLYHQVAGLGSGFLQRELRVATVVSKPRFLGKQIAQYDAIMQL